MFLSLSATFAMVDDANGQADESASTVRDHSQQEPVAFEAPLSLDRLAVAINAEHDAAQVHLKKGAAHAYHAGELLTAAKCKAGHGNWLTWRKAHCHFSERTAQAYMRLYKYCRAHPEQAAELLSAKFTKALRSMPVKSATVADLSDEDDSDDADGDHFHPGSTSTLAKTDADKILAVWSEIFLLGKAIERAPSIEGWLKHAQAHHLEHVQRFGPLVVEAIQALLDQLKNDVQRTYTRH